MKRPLLTPILIVLFVVIITGCIPIYEYVVDSDYSYAGKFHRYSSFGFIKNKNFKGTDLHDNVIRASIKRRMEAQGYTFTEKKPSILISYSLFYEDFGMRTYNQEDLNAWIAEGENEPEESPKSNDSELQPEQPQQRLVDFRSISTNETFESYDPFTCQLNEGALHITFYDRKLRRTVWQGYASGFFGNEAFDNQRYVGRTVSKILDQYRVLAEGFDRQQYEFNNIP